MAGNTTLAKYTVLLEAQSARFEKAIERSERRTKKFDRSVKKSLANVRQAFLALGAAVSLRAIAGAIGRTLDYADSLAKLNDRLGVSTEALSELQFAAERSGVDFRTLTLGMQRLQRRVSEAASGMGEARGALAELGLDAKKLEQLELDQQFEIVADRLSKVTTESDRTRLAFKLFDSEGVALTQIMKDGAAGIRDLREEAGRLGRTLSQEQAQAAVDAKDAITNLDTAFASLTDRLVTSVAPVLTQIANKITDIATAGATVTLEERRAQLLEKIAKLESRSGRNFTARTRNELAGLRVELELTEDALRRIERGADKPDTEPDVAGGVLTKTASQLDYIVDRTGNVERAFAFMYNDMTMLGEDWYDNAEDTIDKFAEANRRATEETADAAQQLGFQFASAFEDAIVQGKKLSDVLKGILQDIARIFIRKTITEPLAAGLSDIFRAEGGPVSAGRPYVVGERGPELFIPGKSGAIVPNGNFGGGGPAITYTIDARGADEGTIMQKMIPLLERTIETTKAEVRRDLAEGRLI